jgi:hypothetical protein
MKIQKAAETLCKALREDQGYYYSYQANIAVAFQDEAYRQKSRDSRKKLHEISNQAAKNFLNLLIREVK